MEKALVKDEKDGRRVCGESGSLTPGKERRRNNSRKGLGAETGVLFYLKRREHV